MNLALFSQSHVNIYISEDRYCGSSIPFRATLFVCCLHVTIEALVESSWLYVAVPAHISLCATLPKSTHQGCAKDALILFAVVRYYPL